jgi:hypothetical protein
MSNSARPEKSAHPPVQKIGPKRRQAEHGGKDALAQYKEVRILLCPQKCKTACVTKSQNELGTKLQIPDPPATKEQD